MIDENADKESELDLFYNPFEISNQRQAIYSYEPEFQAKIQKIYESTFQINQINELVEALKSTDIFLQHQGCIGIRKLLSDDNNPPIQAIIDLNSIPILIQFVKQSIYAVLQFEACWCLCNLTCGTTLQTQQVIDKGAIPLLCKLLVSPYEDTVIQAMWSLGNIACDKLEYRNMILRCGALKHLLYIHNTNKHITKLSTWALKNICRESSDPPYSILRDAVLPFCNTLMTETNSEILSYSAWAIYNLSIHGEEPIQNIIDTGVISTLVRLSNNQDLSIAVPCLKILDNICAGNQEQIEQVLMQNPLPNLFMLINHDRRIIRTSVCNVLNKIAVGNDSQKSQIINQQEYVKSLFRLMVADNEEVAREATKVITNCTTNANSENINQLIDLNILKTYYDTLIVSNDESTIVSILESLIQILECGKNYFMKENKNPYCTQLETLGVLARIQELKEYFAINAEVYKRSLCILEGFFSDQ